ncbi:hypothetical protein N5T34_10115 [Escherichia coli]|nr:hypothetical protein [Escherichia coli]MCW3299653.1 hypothetical protein [Escherichia coli]
MNEAAWGIAGGERGRRAGGFDDQTRRLTCATWSSLGQYAAC